ncbi:22441_t:CDS:1, partial [Gigaspora rosea]
KLIEFDIQNTINIRCKSKKIKENFELKIDLSEIKAFIQIFLLLYTQTQPLPFLP